MSVSLLRGVDKAAFYASGGLWGVHGKWLWLHGHEGENYPTIIK